MAGGLAANTFWTISFPAGKTRKKKEKRKLLLFIVLIFIF